MKKNKHWDYVYSNILTLFPDAFCELVYHSPFELLIAVILSSQTTDVAVNKVTSVLFLKYNSPLLLKDAPIDDVYNIIKSLGLAKKKSINIKECARIIYEQYNGIVPSDIESLMSLPGVGRKTANVIRAIIFDIPCMPVDTHVYRVSKRLDLVCEDDNINEVEKKLTSIIDQKDLIKAHHTLLFFGRYFCTATLPSCANCFYNSKCKVNK